MADHYELEALPINFSDADIVPWELTIPSQAVRLHGERVFVTTSAQTKRKKKEDFAVPKPAHVLLLESTRWNLMRIASSVILRVESRTYIDSWEDFHRCRVPVHGIVPFTRCTASAARLRNAN